MELLRAPDTAAAVAACGNDRGTSRSRSRISEKGRWRARVGRRHFDRRRRRCRGFVRHFEGVEHKLLRQLSNISGEFFIANDEGKLIPEIPTPVCIVKLHPHYCHQYFDLRCALARWRDQNRGRIPV